MCFRIRQGFDWLELLNVYQCSIKNIVRGIRGYDLSPGILSGEGCFSDLETVEGWADTGTNSGDDSFCCWRWNVSRLSGRHCMWCRNVNILCPDFVTQHIYKLI